MHRILKRELKEHVEAQSCLVLYLKLRASLINALKSFFKNISRPSKRNNLFTKDDYIVFE